MSDYWQRQTSGFVRGADNLSGALIQMPRIRAQADLMRRQGGETDARAGLYNTQQGAEMEKTRLLGAQADDAETGNIVDGQLAAALKRVVTNPNDTDAQGDVIAGFGRAYKKNPEQASKAIGNLMSQFQAMTGSTNFAQMGALQGGATSIANTIQKASGGQPPNLQGQPKAPNLGYEETVEDFPAIEASPGKLADIKTHWFGPDTTNSPAVPPNPYIPAKKIVRRTPILAPALEQSAATNAPAVTPPAPAPATGARQQIRFDPATTHPDVQKILTDANNALSKGADYAAVTNRLATQFGIQLK